MLTCCSAVAPVVSVSQQQCSAASDGAWRDRTYTRQRHWARGARQRQRYSSFFHFPFVAVTPVIRYSAVRYCFSMAPCWPFVAVTPVIHYSAVRYCFPMAPCWPFVAVTPVIHYSAVRYCFPMAPCWPFVAVTPVIHYSAVRYCFPMAPCCWPFLSSFLLPSCLS